jgi:hypothetical protein
MVKNVLLNLNLNLSLNFRTKASRIVRRLNRVLCVGIIGVCVMPAVVYAVVGDDATHETDHEEDVLELPEVHVHGLSLNKDQQLGPVAKSTPWPNIPRSLDGKDLDDWMKARLLVSKEAKVTVVVLEPCKYRELTVAGIAALDKWTFDPQMKGDDPIDGELTVRIHFRTK